MLNATRGKRLCLTALLTAGIVLSSPCATATSHGRQRDDVETKAPELKNGVSRGDTNDEAAAPLFAWNQLPPLPDAEGFAGCFAGVSNDALLVAGGANFPQGRPWEGGKKVWHDKIFILERPNGEWIVAEQTLPRPIAYGVSASYGNRVICVGGEDGANCYADCFALAWNATERRVEITSLPPLPRPVANACGAIVGDTLYVAGGIDRPQSTTALDVFYALQLDLENNERQMQWQLLPPWPGVERMQAVAGSQAGSFFLISGVQLKANDRGAPERVTPYLSDGYRYTPPRKGRATGTWTRIADAPRPIIAAPSPAFALGRWHLVVAGGIDSTLLHAPPQEHPGFENDVHLYHLASDSWLRGTDLPAGASRVTAPTAVWRGKYLIVSGESAPGVRSANVYELTSASRTAHPIAWVVLGCYLAGILCMGIYFSRGTASTDDFFLGGKKIPWWAAGISIFGTQLSAITFMAVPAIAFVDNWTRMIGNVMIVAVAPLVVACYLPFFRQLNAASAYQYLEQRFNAGVRMGASAAFMLFQVGRIGIILCLPALALSAVAGIDVYLCIALMGVFCTVYTMLGGIQAVIWNDVIQVTVLLGGAVVCLVMAVIDVGGLATLGGTAYEHGKLRMIEWSWTWSEKNVWVLAIGTFVLALIPYTSDQTIIQRYLTTKDERQAARSIWTNAFMSIPAGLLFYSLGTVLFVFYLHHPNLAVPIEADRIVPSFTVYRLPAAMSGLVIASVLAAAMSSLDSSMNSIATAYVSDFHRRFWPQASDRHCLSVARWLTLFVGALGTGMAMYIAAANVESLFDHFQKILGMLGGALAGLFMLGVFSRRANGPGAIVGAVTGAAMPFLVQAFTTMDPFLYGAVGLLTCVIVGYIASLCIPPRTL